MATAGPVRGSAVTRKRWLAAKARELLAAYERERPAHALRTFAQVEELWESVVRPRLGEFRTMQDLWDGQQPPPEASVWRANWRVGTGG